MSRRVRALEEWKGPDDSLFLAGGITGCPDWQSDMEERLSTLDLVLLNPRRTNFPIEDPTAARTQIDWEYRHLWKAKAILFWFPKESLCPIVLYELGMWIHTEKPIFVGIHPDYARKADVETQLSLANPGLVPVYSLPDLALQVTHATCPHTSG